MCSGGGLKCAVEGGLKCVQCCAQNIQSGGYLTIKQVLKLGLRGNSL